MGEEEREDRPVGRREEHQPGDSLLRLYEGRVYIYMYVTRTRSGLGRNVFFFFLLGLCCVMAAEHRNDAAGPLRPAFASRVALFLLASLPSCGVSIHTDALDVFEPLSVRSVSCREEK